MSVDKQKISIAVDFQAPEFIRSDYAKFVTFLKSYYEYLEQNNKAMDVLRNLDTFNDIDEQTEDAILGIFYSAFLPDFPQVLSTDKAFLLKNVVELYNSKGSHDSIRAFFRIVYGEEVEIYLPKVDILKLNAGSWRKLFKIKITNIVSSSGSATDVYDLLGQEIHQTASNGNKTLRATIVDYDQTTGSTVITTDNIVLGFDSTRPIYTTRNDTGEEVTFTLSLQLADYSITRSGQNYSAGDRVVLATGDSNTEDIAVSEVSYGTIKDLVLVATGDNYSTNDEISFDDNYVFNPSTDVSTANDTITIVGGTHLNTGDIIKYRVVVDSSNEGTAIGGLVHNEQYYIISASNTTVKLALTKEDAINGIAIDLTSTGTGSRHYLVYELPGIVKATAKITRTSSDELLGDDADVEGEFPTLIDDEDKLLFENGFQIKEEYGEPDTYKSTTRNKYNTDNGNHGTSTGSLTSDDFGISAEDQSNDGVVYTRSSYTASNGLIRPLLPAVSDTNKKFSLEWSSNKGINAVLYDEELRIGFAYEDSFASASSYTPTDPMTIIIEFQSNDDYNNLDRYEIVRKWGTTNYPEVKTVTNWSASTPVEFEDLSSYSELQHLGVYQESAPVYSYGERTVSQKGIDPTNKPIIYIRERVSDVDSQIASTQRPWEYRFVFKENTKANVKIYVNSQPIRLSNQLLKTEDAYTLFNEDGSYLINETHSDVDKKVLPTTIAGSNDTFTISNHGFEQGDKVRFTTVDVTSNHSNVAPVYTDMLVQNTAGTPYTVSVSDYIYALKTGSPDISGILVVSDETDELYECVDGINTSTTNVYTLPDNKPKAGIATNGTGKLVGVRKSDTAIVGITNATYTPSNMYYTADYTVGTAPVWTTYALPARGVWGGVEYGNGKYIVIEGTGNPRKEPRHEFVSGARALHSSNAIDWSVVQLPISDYWTELKYVKDRFFALPYGNLRDEDKGSVYGLALENQSLELRAPVGAVFTSVLFASYGDPSGLAGDYVYGAVNSPVSTSRVEKAFLGKNVATIVASDAIFGATVASPKRLYVKLEYSYVNQTEGLMTYDGAVWDKITFPFSKVSDLTYGNGVYIATSFNNTSDYAYSYDLKTWKMARFPISDKELNNYEGIGKSFWSSVVFGYDKFIATFSSDPSKAQNPQTKTKFAVSTDGINWEVHTNSNYASTVTSTGAGASNYIPEIDGGFYNPVTRSFNFIAQNKKRTDTTSTSTYTNYGVGYYGGGQTPTGVTEIDGINFSTEASINPATALVTARYTPCGMYSSTIGYFYAGWFYNGTTSSWSNEIDGIRFSNQTLINPSASTLGSVGGHSSTTGSMSNDGARGYMLSGHISPANSNAIQSFTFPTETSALLSATVSLARYMGASGWSSVTNKGYYIGGYAYAPFNTGTTEIDGIDMTTDVAINPSAVLKATSSHSTTMNFTDYAVICTGYTGTALTNEIERFVFATETVTDPAVTMTAGRNGHAGTQSLNLNKGFIAGAAGPSFLASAERYDNTTGTFTALGNKLATARGYPGAVSEPTTSNSYTTISYFSSDNSGITVFGVRDQLTSGKDYLVQYVDSSNIKLAKSRKDLIDGVYVKTSPQTTDGDGHLKLISDRIDAGSQNSFTKSNKNAQFNVYAKKQSVGVRSAAMKVNQNPTTSTYDDTEKYFRNYTSDNKYYIHEALSEYSDYIIMERSDIAGTDQVNIAFEIDKRTATEVENYVTYPYLASETSEVTYVQANDDVAIPDYSKVRLFVDSSVLQSTNSVDRKPEVRTFNDYGVFGATQDLTVFNAERNKYFNLADPVISEYTTDGVDYVQYRNNYNVIPESHEDKLYVVGLNPDQRKFSSGSGEFGNTGITSFVHNSNIRLNSDATFLDNTFYTVAVSEEQAYYDNDSRKPTKDGRTFNTLSFNIPKEVGDTFDLPFTTSLKNIVASSQYGSSYKTVDYGDKILLGSNEKLASVVQNKKLPIEWTPIFGTGVNWYTINQPKLRIATINFSGQASYPPREVIYPEAKNGDLITVVASATVFKWNNLPSYLQGLQATNTINDGDTTAFYTNNAVRVFLLRNPAWNAVDLTGWNALTFETNKDYIVDAATGASQAVSVYYKDFNPGGPYTIDNNSAMYMFQNLSGINAVETRYGFYKSGNVNNTWDSQMFSRESFVRDCYVRFRVSRVTANSEFMCGLTADPMSNASYDTIDYSWYPTGGNANIYENGSSIGVFGTYTADTVFEIQYDGVNIIYYLDGVEKRRVARSIGSPLHVDTSFYSLYTATTPVACYDMEFGRINVPTVIEIPRTDVDNSSMDEIGLEDNTATIAAESSNDVNGNYSLTTPTIAIEFYSPSLAKQVADNGLTASNSNYHMVYYCDRAEYLNVSTDTQKTTYKFYNCWSPTGTHVLNNAASVNDYVVTIRDLTKSDYIVKKKNDFVNKMTTNGLLYRDVWITSYTDNYGKYVKFYPSYADSVAGTNVIPLTTLNIGTTKSLGDVTYSDASVTGNASKSTYSYYGAIEESDLFRTLRFDPKVNVSSNAISINNHNLQEGDRVLYRVDFNGAKVTGLTDNTIYSVLPVLQSTYGFIASGFNAINGSTSYFDRFDYNTEAITANVATIASGRKDMGSVNASTKGYFGGGYNVSLGYVTEIDGIDFPSSTRVNPSSVLYQARSETVGTSSKTKGYFMGGYSFNTPSAGNWRYDTVDALTFSTETAALLGSTLPSQIHSGAGMQSATKGYAIAGITNSGSSNTSAFYIEFATDTCSPLSISASTAGARTSTSGVTYIDGNVGYYDGRSSPSTLGKLNFTTETVSSTSVSVVYRPNTAGTYSMTKGYFAGGYNSPTFYTEIDGINFQTETATNPSAVLSSGRDSAGGLSYNAANTGALKLSTDEATALTLTASTEDGKRNYLQVLPESLDFGSTKHLYNTKTKYTVSSSELVGGTIALENIRNAGIPTSVVKDRTDIYPPSSTAFVFKNAVDFSTGDHVHINVGSGDTVIDTDGNITTGVAELHAFAIRHTDRIISFAKNYEDSINGIPFFSGWLNNQHSTLNNSSFHRAESVVEGAVWDTSSEDSPPAYFKDGMKVKFIGNLSGVTSGTTYYMDANNDQFTLHNNVGLSTPQSFTNTSYTNLIELMPVKADKQRLKSPMITGTIKEDVTISYSPAASRETGTIESIELTSKGSYNRIPNATIITDEGRLGSGADIYPIPDGIGALHAVEFIDGGTHSTSKTMYPPMSFFGSSITGDWIMGENVINTSVSSAVCGVLSQKDGRYFKIESNGTTAATTLTYGHTLVGETSGATATVGRSINISNVTQAKPAVVTTSTHNIKTGERVYISGITGATIATGTYYANVLSPTKIAIYSDEGLATPYDSTSRTAYTSGGVVYVGLYTATATAIVGDFTLSSANSTAENYDNDKNLILPTTKMQDSYYYQDYSYAIRSGVTFQDWKPYFNKLVHPAGIAVFGEVDYNTINSGQTLMGNTTVSGNEINNTKTATSTTVTTT